MQSRPIFIGTRGSALALAQADEVKNLLRRAFPKLAFEIKTIKTTGDKMQDLSLSTKKPASSKTSNSYAPSSIDKGLFTKEIEMALMGRHIDIAIHSLKDLPTTLPSGLILAATPKRADPRDMLIYRSNKVLVEVKEQKLAKGESILERLSKQENTSEDDAKCRKFPVGTTLKGLPQDAGLATSNPRRRAQILAVRPDIHVDDIRGNVETRLKKFEKNPAWDGIILAAAGLDRLQFQFQNRPVKGAGETVVWDTLIAEPIEPSIMLPAVGQAAIGLEIRIDDERTSELLTSINHFGTFAAVRAERALLRGLGGGCATPIGAFADYDATNKIFRLTAVVFSPDGKKHLRSEVKGSAEDPELLGESTAKELLAQGAGELLA